MDRMSFLSHFNLPSSSETDGKKGLFPKVCNLWNLPSQDLLIATSLDGFNRRLDKCEGQVYEMPLVIMTTLPPKFRVSMSPGSSCGSRLLPSCVASELFRGIWFLV